jgi:cephalosporin hydroxylase
MNLTELANLYCTDKGTTYSECHNYTSVYESIITSTESKKILEIGLDTGASTLMWQRYNPNIKNIVIDITTQRLKREYISEFITNKNITIELGDQSDDDFLNKIGQLHGPFDYIVDDGSHNQQHIQISFSVLFKYLNSKGYYFIEDLHVHNSKKYSKIQGDSTVYMFDNFIKTGRFDSLHVDNQILNSYVNQIESIEYFNNKKLLVIKKI